MSVAIAMVIVAAQFAALSAVHLPWHLVVSNRVWSQG
jgi:hypothetical protein